jgi:hypothetical protein
LTLGSRGRQGGEHCIRAHGTVQDDGGGQVPGHGVIAVAAVGRQLDASSREPAREDADQLAGQLGLLQVRRPVPPALLLGAVEAEEHWQRPRPTGERDSNDDRESDPAVAEAEDPVLPGGADRVDVGPQAEDVWPLAGRQRVVQGDPDGQPLGHEREDAKGDEMPKVVWLPGPAREETVEALPVYALGDGGGDQRLGDGVIALGEDPSNEQHDEVAVPWLGQGLTKDFHNVEECGSSPTARGSGPRGRSVGVFHRHLPPTAATGPKSSRGPGA